MLAKKGKAILVNRSHCHGVFLRWLQGLDNHKDSILNTSHLLSTLLNARYTLA